jgi:hypothetical protein
MTGFHDEEAGDYGPTLPKCLAHFYVSRVDRKEGGLV